MTYKPKPADTGKVELPEGLLDLREKIAENVHEVWARGRIEEGWVYGPERDDEKMTNPCLRPYSELPEYEKKVDRDTAMETIKLIIMLGYSITPNGE